jgi:hypothetical protein
MGDSNRMYTTDRFQQNNSQHSGVILIVFGLFQNSIKDITTAHIVHDEEKVILFLEEV